MSLPELFGDRNAWGPKLLAFLRQSHDDDGDLLPGVVDTIRDGLALQVDLDTLDTEVSIHNANTANPHAVTKTQVGLGNVDNTSDANKPVSTAQQTALNLKANQTSLDTTNTNVGTNTTNIASNTSAIATHTTQIGYTNPGSALSVGQYAGGGTAGAPVKVNERVFDVTHPRFGAVGNGSTNDRAAIQAAIDAAVAAGGGTVWFPKGTYKVQITTATTVTSPSSSGQHCLKIDGDNVTLDGAPGAIISCYVLNGDPDTNWEVVSSAVWRGGGIYITGGATWASRRRNVTIRNLEIDGNFTYTGSHSWPANTGTGAGWDTTHKGIWFQNDLYHDNHLVENVHVHNFSGEVIYSGGSDDGSQPVLGRFIIRHCEIHDTNGSAVSMAGRFYSISYCRIYTAAGSGIENASKGGYQDIGYNRVYDTKLDAISYVGYDTTIGSAAIHHNTLDQPSASMSAYGIGLFSAWNVAVHHNVLVDCGIRSEIGSGYPNDTAQDVDIVDNRILANTKNVAIGINMGFNAGEMFRHRVHRNTTGRTAAAITGGFDVTQPFGVYPTTDWSQFDLKDNQFNGTHGTSSSSKCQNTLLTTTSQTTVVSRKPNPDSQFLVCIAYQVITATTNVTINITTTDPVGSGAVTIAALPLTAVAVGLYTLPCYLVPIDARATLSVKVTAGTANQVYLSASIREI